LARLAKAKSKGEGKRGQHFVFKRLVLLFDFVLMTLGSASMTLTHFEFVR